MSPSFLLTALLIAFVSTHSQSQSSVFGKELGEDCTDASECKAPDQTCDTVLKKCLKKAIYGNCILEDPNYCVSGARCTTKENSEGKNKTMCYCYEGIYNLVVHGNTCKAKEGLVGGICQQPYGKCTAPDTAECISQQCVCRSGFSINITSATCFAVENNVAPPVSVPIATLLCTTLLHLLAIRLL